jgi:hypothetical protein
MCGISIKHERDVKCAEMLALNLMGRVCLRKLDTKGKTIVFRISHKCAVILGAEWLRI